VLKKKSLERELLDSRKEKIKSILVEKNYNIQDDTNIQHTLRSLVKEQEEF
jgi:hypothetical protein